MKPRKIILRRRNEETEWGGKYEYFTFCIESAAILDEGQEVRVLSKDWKAMLAPKKNKQ